MKPFMLLGLAFLVVMTAGCGGLGAPTDQSPAWVQMMDRISHVEAKQVTPPATAENPNPRPITVVTQSPPSDPTGGSVPVAGVAISALSLAWYFIRKMAVSHENAITKLGNSVPVETHQAAVDALGTSTPARPAG